MDIEKRLGPRPYEDKVLLSTPPSTLTLQGTGNVADQHPPDSPDHSAAAARQGEPEWFRHMGLPYSPPGSGRPTNPLDDLAALKRAVHDLKNRVAQLEMDADNRGRYEYLFLLFSGITGLAYLVKKFLPSR